MVSRIDDIIAAILFFCSVLLIFCASVDLLPFLLSYFLLGIVRMANESGLVAQINRLKAPKMECDDCGEVFSTSYNLKRHVEKQHALESDDDDDEEKVQGCFQHLQFQSSNVLIDG